MSSFVFASWNIKSNLNKDFDPRAIAAEIAKQDVDVIALQEVREDKFKLLIAELRKIGWSPNGKIYRFLAGWHVVHRPHGTYRFGPAILARIPLSNLVRRRLPEVPGKNPTGALRAIVQPKGWRRPMYVYSAHLSVNWEPATHVNQVDVLRKFLAEGEHRRKIFGGDTNLKPDDPQIQGLLSDWDQTCKDGFTFETPSNLFAKIDYIFYDKNLYRASSYGLIVTDLTDHCMLKARFTEL